MEFHTILCTIVLIGMFSYLLRIFRNRRILCPILATVLATLCHRNGKTLPMRWQKFAKPMAKCRHTSQAPFHPSDKKTKRTCPTNREHVLTYKYAY